MKPSEYLKNKYAKGYEEHSHTSIEVHCAMGSCGIDDAELDNRFIDREELKDKINKKLNEKIKIWGESQPEVTIADEIYQEAEHKVYKEILELLK